MKRGESKMSSGVTAAGERRKFVRATLVGSALIAPKSGGRACTAVLDNVNTIGAGLRTKERFAARDKVTVSLAFLDAEGAEQQEKLEGTVVWIKDWEKGFLIGVVWDDVVTQDTNRWLHYYLEETLKA